MRRIALILSLLTGAAALALIIGASAQGSDTFRFDVIFDNARGLVSGQLVKIAGANAGTITGVVVTPNDQARVEATVTGPFRFHTDASCAIRPQGLIAENYVECDPGALSAPLLPARGGYPPTVPVTRTTEPVSLTDLFNIFNLPTAQRLQVLLDELGIATAGEGDNLNAVLRRANPTLQLADQVISILNHQKAELATAVDATSTIAAQGASHTAAIQDFISRAAALTSLTAGHASPLSLAINRLPGLLSAAQPALSQLDTVARDGTPLLASLRTAAPGLNQVSADLGPFTAVAKPALAKIGSAITAAIPAIRAANPLVKTLHRYIVKSGPETALFSKTSVNLQAHGFTEGFLSILYYVAGALSRYDSTSHLLSILLIGPDNGTCGNYATTPVPACSAHYGTQPAYTPQASRRPAARRQTAAPRRGAGTPQSATTPQSGTKPPASPPVKLPPAPTVQQTTQSLQNLVNYLLK